jgi:hypothetical protein
MARPAIAPILDPDLPEFCAFLHTHLNRAIQPDEWARTFTQPWGQEKPNNGFMLRDPDGALLGGIGAVYARRTIRDRRERFCNITSWCVLEPYRSHSLGLAMALLSQDGFHFTDLTPTPVVAGTLAFLKFKAMDGRETVTPNMPWWTPGVDVISDLDAIARVLPPEHAAVFEDHRHVEWFRHVVVGKPQAYCHVAYKPGILKHMPSAVIVHVSDYELFLRYQPRLGAYFLRHGMVTARIESRFLPRRPVLSAQVSGYHNKMFRSETLGEADVTNFYSELAGLNI